jgi:hypothetical protein
MLTIFTLSYKTIAYETIKAGRKQGVMCGMDSSGSGLNPVKTVMNFRV